MRCFNLFDYPGDFSTSSGEKSHKDSSQANEDRLLQPQGCFYWPKSRLS
ncbi:unnamed protein product [Acanthoscelides obtectus]|uniref:Uncharacterized protein n=1 Tax=Acanthoscelides obtectus TaxID=200917 RepID=A0A9P0PI55_ACAOB|nr:unnamed protein product [Acanthoscelides obtectus]CAK1679689.1 hypothetical protein AOBTE_LOCUS32411 [Acanthoscelides obtectus]